nr:hypothetical protein [Streptomyces broussonetiae]
MLDLRCLEWFHDHVHIERILFRRLPRPDGGSLTPGVDGAPGLGLILNTERAQPHRVG